MQPISVVIIAKNEAHILPETLRSVKLLSDDLLVCDTGSTDATIPVALQNGARVLEEEWKGYGHTKNKVNAEAKYDWILQLDADEVVDETLVKTILNLKLDDEKEIFKIRFKNYLGNKWVRFGEWGREERLRLFNINNAMWSELSVNEKLVYDDSCHITLLNGFILHKTMLNKEEYEEKMIAYAQRNAEKDSKENKKFIWLRKFFSPSLSFFRSYILKLGFLDGLAGFVIASMTAKYTRAKYEILHQLQNAKNKK
ncbi:MAG: glycosyltransferase family 2 protein [Lacibacter sp.]